MQKHTYTHTARSGGEGYAKWKGEGEKKNPGKDQRSFVSSALLC